MISSALRRLLVPLLRDVRDGKPMKFRHRSAAEQSLFLVQRKPSPSRKKPAQARKEVKRALHREETGAIREAVRARAGGVCEGCGERWGFRGWEMDHWLNGNGRRREKQSVETCWALCGSTMIPGSCHYKRQIHKPSAAVWNAIFAAHCLKHAYPFTPHIEHASLRPAPAAPPSTPSGERSGAGQEGPQARAERPHAHPGIPEDCYCVPALPPSEKERG